MVDGFRLDHGFQVLLTAYPEAKRLLDYEALDLQRFLPGALLLLEGGQQRRIGDPMRDWSSLWPTLQAPLGGWSQKMKMLQLRRRLKQTSVDHIFAAPEQTTATTLAQEYQMGNTIQDRFFAPFYSGIFLEKDLRTSRRMFDFTFKMFSEGYATIPRLGMEEIPKQLVAQLDEKQIITGQKVTRIEGQQVHTEQGTIYESPNIILATEANQLVAQHAPQSQLAHVPTTHIHFVSDKNPIARPLIALNTHTDRLVNNICVISQVSADYASNGQHLISLTVFPQTSTAGDKLIQTVRTELRQWWGAQVDQWQHLHTRTIPYALPDQQQVRNDISPADMQVREGLFICGDHLLNGSINAAMKSGRLVAEVIGGKTN